MSDPTCEPSPSEEPQDGIPPATRRRLKRGCQLGCLLVILFVAAPFAVRYLLVREAEARLAEVQAGLSFKLIPADEIEAWIGPMPAADENAAPLYAELSEKWYAVLEEELERDASESGVAEAEARTDEDGDNDEDEDADEPCTVDQRLDEWLVVWGIQDADQMQYGDDESELPPRDVAEARKFLGRFKKVLALRDQAVQRPFCRNRRDWSDPFEAMLPNLSHIIGLARLTALEAMVDSQAGDQAAAYRKMAAILRMAGHMEQEPTPINVLVGRVVRDVACYRLADLVAAGPPDEAAWQEIRSLTAKERAEILPRVGQLETIGMDALLRDYARAKVSMTSSDDVPSAAEKAVVWLLKWRALNDRAAYLRLMDRQIEIAALPPCDMAGEFARFDADECADLDEFSLTRELLVGLRDTANCLDAGCAADRLMTLAVELSRYKAVKGRYPETLDEIPLPDGLPLDPFSGKPLGYRRTDEGFVVWSIGPDLTDDGGRGTLPFGSSFSDYEAGGDIILRVPPLPEGGSTTVDEEDEAE